jgi:hypothetical protein
MHVWYTFYRPFRENIRGKNFPQTMKKVGLKGFCITFWITWFLDDGGKFKNPVIPSMKKVFHVVCL